jgi:hypothetical protein
LPFGGRNRELQAAADRYLQGSEGRRNTNAPSFGSRFVLFYKAGETPRNPFRIRRHELPGGLEWHDRVPPYYYERVLADSSKYPKVSTDGKFPAWWETYFRDEGFESVYCRFGGLYALDQYGGSVAGMLGMDIPHLNRGHIVAVDELGVVDPADNAPDHVPLDNYVWNRKQDGVIFHTEWLAVRRRPTDHSEPVTGQLQEEA